VKFPWASGHPISLLRSAGTDLGYIFTLSGPSGVGKTTFLEGLFEGPGVTPDRLSLIPRYTDRPRRLDEKEGFEYYFTSTRGLLQKVFASDFIHFEKWGNFYSAIETNSLEDVLESDADAVVLASILGSSRLRATYGSRIVPLYLWTGTRLSLMDPRCLESDYADIKELKWRIAKKLQEEGFSEFETAELADSEFLDKRMIDNFVDIAGANGRLRSAEVLHVVANPHDKMEQAVQEFAALRAGLPPFQMTAAVQKGGGCFVLMPFADELRPVYEDHIVPTCKKLGITVARADQIFSTNPVMHDVREAVTSARYVIADLTHLNPNVFYEVGICHALGKDVILITQDRDDQIPFDLRHIRRIHYEYTPRGMQALEEALKQTIITLQARPII
jgi:guanylate kinase